MDHHPSDGVAADTPIVSPLYTTQEVARLLHVSQGTVQGWIRGGSLTAVRYGRLLRIRQADLAAFGEVLNQRTAPALAEDVSPRPAPAGAAQE